MATYSGDMDKDTNLVLKDGQRLRVEPSQRLQNKSSEFSWGYGGSGPAQLALALLYDVTGQARLSESLHQEFKWAHVAKWGRQWTMTSQEIRQWIAEQPVSQSEIKMAGAED